MEAIRTLVSVQRFRRVVHLFDRILNDLITALANIIFFSIYKRFLSKAHGNNLEEKKSECLRDQRTQN